MPAPQAAGEDGQAQPVDQRRPQEFERVRQADQCEQADIGAADAFGGEPGLAAGFRQLAHAQDVALPLRHADHAARVEQVEEVGGLDALIVGGQRQEVLVAARALFEQ